MTTGYVLIFAVLILGGVIATLGDRIGMRVGKARLSLFRLRPRQTATVVSILTGSVISASTLGLLFGVSRQLRTGVFELEQIQSDLDRAQSELAQAEADLKEAQTESTAIEAALSKARRQQRKVQRELRDINESLNQAVDAQRLTQTQLGQTRSQLTQLRSQLGMVSQQAEQLRGEIQRLESERADLLRQQEAVQGQLTERDQQIAMRDREISQREQTLSQLQAQQAMLQEEVTESERQLADLESQLADSEQQFQDLFRGSVVVARNQPLVSGLIRVSDSQEARQTVDQLLVEANRLAIQQLAPGTSLERQVILIPQEEVTRLVNRIRDRREYVVRILSAANYIIGEPCVVAEADPCIQVFIDAAVNEVIYAPDERLATVNIDPRTLTDQGLVEQLNLLRASLEFRARQDGFVGDTLQIANGRTDALIAFLDEVKNSHNPVEIHAIAAEPIYTVGPLRIELVAVSNREIVARTDELPSSSNPAEDDGAPDLRQ
ncbi:MAG: DUF3084 domain-containing protein [Cyanobacteria bacterium P01_F01_bin.86]